MMVSCRPQPVARERLLSSGLSGASKQSVPERVTVADRAERTRDDGRNEQGNRAPQTEAPGAHPDDHRDNDTKQSATDTADDARAAVMLWFWIDFGLVAHRLRIWLRQTIPSGRMASAGHHHSIVTDRYRV
jgi:hypothetical protein